MLRRSVWLRQWREYLGIWPSRSRRQLRQSGFRNEIQQRGGKERAMANNVDGILEQIKGLTLLEAADLVKKMEEAFGVSAAAAAPVMVAGGGGAGGAAAGE